MKSCPSFFASNLMLRVKSLDKCENSGSIGTCVLACSRCDELDLMTELGISANLCTQLLGNEFSVAAQLWKERQHGAGDITSRGHGGRSSIMGQRRVKYVKHIANLTTLQGISLGDHDLQSEANAPEHDARSFGRLPTFPCFEQRFPDYPV